MPGGLASCQEVQGARRCQVPEVARCQEVPGAAARFQKVLGSRCQEGPRTRRGQVPGVPGVKRVQVPGGARCKEVQGAGFYVP